MEKTVDMVELDELLLDLGFSESVRGTEYVREAVKMYAAGHRSLSREIYPAIGKACGTNAANVERCVRFAIGRAWSRGGVDAQERLFGFTVDPDRGCPTTSEFVARLARVCSR